MSSFGDWIALFDGVRPCHRKADQHERLDGIIAGCDADALEVLKA